MKNGAAYMRQWREKNPGYSQTASRRFDQNRAAFLSRYKLAAGCIDCGYNAHACALDFDHVVGEKLFAVSSMRTTRLRNLIAEIDKCVVRCANCHRIKTYASTK